MKKIFSVFILFFLLLGSTNAFSNIHIEKILSSETQKEERGVLIVYGESYPHDDGAIIKEEVLDSEGNEWTLNYTDFTGLVDGAKLPIKFTGDYPNYRLITSSAEYKDIVNKINKSFEKYPLLESNDFNGPNCNGGIWISKDKKSFAYMHVVDSEKYMHGLGPVGLIHDGELVGYNPDYWSYANSCRDILFSPKEDSHLFVYAVAETEISFSSREKNSQYGDKEMFYVYTLGEETPKSYPMEEYEEYKDKHHSNQRIIVIGLENNRKNFTSDEVSNSWIRFSDDGDYLYIYRDSDKSIEKIDLDQYYGESKAQESIENNEKIVTETNIVLTAEEQKLYSDVYRVLHGLIKERGEEARQEIKFILATHIYKTSLEFSSEGSYDEARQLKNLNIIKKLYLSL